MFGDYNTQKNPVILKEYGRNIQMLVKYVNSIEDREIRNRSARALVELMKQINPSLREGGEDIQKVWDDMVIMSDFEIEIDGPFPKPERGILSRKPQRMRYRDKQIKYKHFGLNLQLLVDAAIDLESEEDREVAVIHIGKLMKGFASVWNNENLDDEVILRNIRDLSRGILDIDLEKVREHKLFENVMREKHPKYDNNQRDRTMKRRRKRKKKN